MGVIVRTDGTLAIRSEEVLAMPRSLVASGSGNSARDVPVATLKKLKGAARAVAKHAYCPYSGFSVGAAALSTKGETFTGCNVENASYGLTICAERSAIFQMIARAHTALSVLVIYTPTPTPWAPCGACRQVIAEFGPEARVISVCDGPEILRLSLAELLPHAFGPHNLK